MFLSSPVASPLGSQSFRDCTQHTHCVQPLKRHKPGPSVHRVYAADAASSAAVLFLGAGGKQISVECPKDSYILDSGLDNDLELPYTCRGGICGELHRIVQGKTATAFAVLTVMACVGRVVEGKVDMSDVDDISFTLSEEEQEMGLALLCMARPLTDCKIETQSDWGYQLGTGGWQGATGEIAGKKVQPLNPWGSDA